MINGIPTAKCETSEIFNTHLTYYLRNLQRIVGYYQPMKWRQRIRTMRIKRQQAYAEIVRMLTGRYNLRKDDEVIRNTVIAYGGGSFSSTSPGYAPAPNKGLLKELQNWCKVRLSAEYLTTRTCSGCNGRMADTRHPRTLQCTNICKMQRNRDVNAAVNIRYVSAYRNDHNGQRPEPFIPDRLRNPQQRQQGGQQQQQPLNPQQQQQGGQQQQQQPNPQQQQQGGQQQQQQQQ
jgi:hypothetical protein